MTQYISKAAIVAEIKSRIANLDKLGNRLYIQTNFPEQYRLIHGYESVLSFLDTLEVKGVDLEEAIDKIWKPRFSLGWDDKSLLSVSYKGFEIIAKHFFWT